MRSFTSCVKTSRWRCPAWRPTWDLENQPGYFPDPERCGLRAFAFREWYSGRPHERPLVHGHRACALCAGQLRLRIRRGCLLLDHGAARRFAVHQYDDPLHGDHVGDKRHVAGDGIPSLRASADPLDSAYGAGDQDVCVEYLAFDRCGPRGDSLRLYHGYRGHEHDGRPRRRGDDRRQSGRCARRCRRDGARHDFGCACRGVEMVFLGTFGHRIRRGDRIGRLACAIRPLRSGFPNWKAPR